MARTTDLPTLLEGFRLSCLAEGKQPTTIRGYMGKLKISSAISKPRSCPPMLLN